MVGLHQLCQHNLSLIGAGKRRHNASIIGKIYSTYFCKNKHKVKGRPVWNVRYK